jgi:hypothetical protein
VLRGACVFATCDAGFDDCATLDGNGCETDIAMETDCGACGVMCNAGETCAGGACRTILGDTCGTAVDLAPGPNTVAWTAFTADYITTDPSCGSGYAPTGPDLGHDVHGSHRAAHHHRVSEAGRHAVALHRVHESLRNAHARAALHV